jgi:murein DD-endopeptidase MepM/ murein hydrolase activator NlpD
MGEIYQKAVITSFFLCILCAGIVLCAAPAQAGFGDPQAPGGTCFIGNPLAAQATSVGPYGAERGGGTRSHRGVDIMAPMCTPAPHQPGCNIVPNPSNSGSPLWDHGDSGYGLWIKYSCGNNVEVRYTHMNSFENGIGKVGKSGNAKNTPPHIHYEVVVYLNGVGHKVDPQCVWGAHPNPSECCKGVSNCNGLGTQRSNMCDPTIRENLWKNAKARGYGSGLTTSHSYTEGVAPSTFSEGHRIDREDCDPGNTSEDHHEPIIDDSPGREVPPPPDWEPPPVNPVEPPPPPPTEPGTPGGPPELVPKTPTEVEKFSGCATDTWTAMVNQAVMETRRQDILNKRFIVKSQTVLDYACFDFPKDADSYVKVTADKLGPVFSETKFWANKQVDIIGETITIKRELGSKSLDNALMSVVQNAAINYRNGMFTHPYLSGTAPVSPSSNNCDLMDKIWQAAKCKHFDGVDVFYTFEDLTTKEPREFPPNYKCSE